MDNNCFSGLLYSIHTVKDAVQIAATGRLFLALDRAGRVHVRRYLWERFYFPDQPDYCRQQIDTIESWRDIRRILLAEPDTVIAQKNSGELVYAGSGQDLFGTFGEASFRQLQDREIVGACSYCGGESYYFVFLDADGILHSRRWQEERRFRQVVGLDHAFLGLTTDGQVVSFQGPLEESAENWPRMKQIAIGRRSFDSYDDLFLAGLRDDEA